MSRKKTIFIITTLLVLNTFAFVSIILAYMVSTSQKTYVLYKPESKISVVETLSDKKIVAIKNESNFSVYVRALFVAVYRSVSNPQMIIPAEKDVNYVLDASWNIKWILNGKYYYYNDPLSPGASTSNLLYNVVLKSGKTVPEGYQLEVSVLADSIQAEPTIGIIESWEFVPKIFK